jgi:uncharacterized protein (TIGR02588 family)
MGPTPMADRTTQARTTAEERLLGQRSAGEMRIWQEVVAGFGALLVGGVLAYLVWQVLTAVETPPAITIRVMGIEAQPVGHLVLFEAVNDGGSTAAGLEIAGRLRQNGTTLEEARVTLDYLPAGSSGRGGLAFARDPRSFDVHLQAEGYTEP